MKRFGYLPNTVGNFDLRNTEILLEAEAFPLEDLSHSAMKQINIVVLFGGEDISPYCYKEPPVHTGADAVPSVRDEREMNLISHARARMIPMLGICRGAQMLCTQLGGKLWQHVDNHEGITHDLLFNGQELKTNSYHHQMMIPRGVVGSKGMVPMTVLGWCKTRSPKKYGAQQEPVETTEDFEPEIIWDKPTNSLMIQGHPEWVGTNHDLFKLTRQLVKEKLYVKGYLSWG